MWLGIECNYWRKQAKNKWELNDIFGDSNKKGGKSCTMATVNYQFCVNQWKTAYSFEANSKFTNWNYGSAVVFFWLSYVLKQHKNDEKEKKTIQISKMENKSPNDA